jgi:hypothetical protein
VYKLFFKIPKRNDYNKKIWANDFLFHSSYNDNQKRTSFEFSYVITPSIQGGWEGVQGFIFLEKIRGKYVIGGMDTVP